ncbi:hypothetical protein [Acinetobacter oleivorans]
MSSNRITAAEATKLASSVPETIPETILKDAYDSIRLNTKKGEIVRLYNVNTTSLDILNSVVNTLKQDGYQAEAVPHTEGMYRLVVRWNV